MLAVARWLYDCFVGSDLDYLLRWFVPAVLALLCILFLILAYVVSLVIAHEAATVAWETFHDGIGYRRLCRGFFRHPVAMIFFMAFYMWIRISTGVKMLLSVSPLNLALFAFDLQSLFAEPQWSIRVIVVLCHLLFTAQGSSSGQGVSAAIVIFDVPRGIGHVSYVAFHHVVVPGVWLRHLWTEARGYRRRSGP